MKAFTSLFVLALLTIFSAQSTALLAKENNHHMNHPHKKKGEKCDLKAHKASGMGISQEGPIHIYHAHANPQVKTSPGAVYLHIKNTTDSADELLSISSTAAGSVEIHETMMHGTMAMMNRVQKLDIPAKGHVKLGQGGLHLMLISLKDNLKKGEKIQITLNFKKAGAVTMDVPVMFPPRAKHKKGDAPMDHSKHHNMKH